MGTNWFLNKTRAKLAATLAIAMGALLFPVLTMAQIITGSLSGAVQDASNAALPGATISLHNDLNGDTRTITSNTSGMFNFAGVTTGDYTVTISAPNYQNYKISGIHLDPGDSRSLASIILTVGKVSETVEVSADINAIPLDTGERSDLITSEQIEHLSVEGRDVTELLKTLPGFAIANQGVNNSAYDPSQVSVNGAMGNFAANGNPIQGIYLMLDGADITDPGNYGAALQNVNYDQVGEVKVQVSNFGADVSSGPVVIAAVTKAGGNAFHGDAYTYGRTTHMNSMDALAKSTGQAKPDDREIYPGFTFGGPIVIPGTSFNKKRNLTFFVGGEDYAQRNSYAYGSASGALVHALVPTENMRSGNFSSDELKTYLGELYTNSGYSNISAVPTMTIDGQAITNGQIASSYQDKGFKAIYATFPKPNATATNSNPYNWQSTNLINNNLWEGVARVDDQISERHHLFGRYTVERGKQGVPGVAYYNQGELNTPGNGIETVNSQSAAANLTTIISATATNQLFGSLAYLNASYDSADHSVLTNYAYQGAYATGRTVLPELANYWDGSGLPRQLTPDYSLSPIFSHKFDPQGGDNFTKLWGKHTAVFGVFVGKVINNQRTAFVSTNGALSQYYMPGAGGTMTDVDGSTNISSGNWVANNYQGVVSGYSQSNLLPATNLYFWNNAFFATDSWHIKPRVTINYGVRFQHLGLWNDAYGKGIVVFRPSLITTAASVSPYPGFIWHAYDKTMPLSGNKSEPFYIEPRFGAAWDVYGNGKTVLRGGWGEYRSHDDTATAGNAVQQTQYLTSVSYGGGGISLKAISDQKLATGYTLPVTNTIGVGNAPGVYYGLTDGDREQPLTDTYSVTLNQQLPQGMALMIGYVGNNSRFLQNNGSNQTVTLDNVNAIPMGGLYKQNPITGGYLTPTGTTTATTASGASTTTVNQYRPLNTALVQYSGLDVPNHNLFANYNALQAAISRSTGHLFFNINYTYGKALGIRGANGSGMPADPFHMWNNYGPESFDRRHIFNATYTYVVKTPIKEKLASALINGWEISGITTWQSGPDLPSVTNNPGFGMSGHIGSDSTSADYITISNKVYLGTPDVSLQPTLKCNPSLGFSKKNQYINGGCFGTPELGSNGAYRFPYLSAPAYFNSDLSLQKTFKLKHDQNIVFRTSAFNVMNHPLHTFTGNFTDEYTLTMANTSGSYADGVADQSLGFGTAPYTSGRRMLEMVVKYSF